MQGYFRKACDIVDSQIARTGEVVSAIDRNKRVAAAEHQLKHGDSPDGKARLMVLRFSAPSK